MQDEILPDAPATTPFDPPEERHDTLYFSDGNVVLSATNADKSSTILFCIHRSSLTRRSEVFESMFTLPGAEGETTSEKYEDLPLVRMPDSAEEVEALLNAIYDPYPVLERSKKSDTPLRIRKALHMSSKYLMGDLRARLVRVLEQEWPLRLRDMEQMARNLDDVYARVGYFSDTGWPTYFVPEPAAAIALAEDFNILSILPAAYYDLLRCEPGTSWDGTFERMERDEMRNEMLLTGGDKPARWECLSAESLTKVLRLQKYIQNEYWDLNIRLFHEGTECKESCRDNFSEIVGDSWKAPSRVQERDILRALQDISTGLNNTTSVCYKCVEAYLGKIKNARAAIWKGFKAICLSGLESTPNL
ncbi:hypothetical protein SCHPADRAFT_873836 [Schizopora paradoxa]|uniref:BTB domain-containing protein n=1 Tax=Schizopora paradoxa TaxID=27342 RepID=A0A0H2RPP4_9AGAM|nr:hypothetical protein SCHPADRAFT_873836 [Schizopora paradoxa]